MCPVSLPRHPLCDFFNPVSLPRHPLCDFFGPVSLLRHLCVIFLVLFPFQPMPQIQHNGPGFRYVIGIYREGESQPVEKQEIQDWRINEKFYSVGAQVYEPYIITLRAVNNLGSAGRKAVRIRGFTAEDSRLKLVCLCMRVCVCMCM